MLANKAPNGGNNTQEGNLCGLEPQLIKLEFIIYLPKLKVLLGALPPIHLKVLQ